MFGTLYFFGCCALLIAGYVVYGAFVEHVFGADASRKTPVMTRRDGVDFEPMPLWKLYMSQMINIAGLGPVIGTILGALYGPVALLWVVFGSIFAGAVHDYIAGMISIREDGISYPEIIGRNLGSGARIFMECFTIIFMVMVGATFVLAPAALLANLFPHFLTNLFPSAPTLAWSVIIFAYYFVATIIPFDRIVSRFYPIVGVMLIFMALGLIVALFAKGYTILPNTDFFTNVHPAHTPVWPILFITIACGAISGFHATQSPLRARCMTNEKQGRRVFYGAMITEGVLGLIWATLALSFYPDAASLFRGHGSQGRSHRGGAADSHHPARTRGRPAGHSRRGASAHQHRRHRLPRRPRHAGRPFPHRSEERDQAHSHRRSAVLRRRGPHPAGLPHHLEIFRLGQPDHVLREPLGLLRVARQARTPALDHQHSRRVHDHGLHGLHLLCAHRIPSFHGSVHHHRHRRFLSCLALFLHFCRSSSVSAAKPAACMK